MKEPNYQYRRFLNGKEVSFGGSYTGVNFSGQRTESQIASFRKGKAIIGAKLAGDVSGQFKTRFRKLGKFIMAKASKNPQLRLNLKMKTLEVDVWDEPSASGPYMVEVVDGLFMGDSVSSRNRQLLSDRGIKVVFNLCAHRCVSPFADELTYHDYLLQDSQDFEIAVYFEEITGLIHHHLGRGEPIFVHCQKGLSRAPTLVMAFLIRFHGMDYDSALDLLRQKSEISSLNPNPNFSFSLVSYQQKFKQGSSSDPV